VEAPSGTRTVAVFILPTLCLVMVRETSYLFRDRSLQQSDSLVRAKNDSNSRIRRAAWVIGDSLLGKRTVQNEAVFPRSPSSSSVSDASMNLGADSDPDSDLRDPAAVDNVMGLS